MSKKNKERVARIDDHSLTVSELSQEENILPTSEELKGYKAVDERLVDLVIEYTKKEQSHRHMEYEKRLKQEYQVQISPYKIYRNSQYLVFILLLVMLLGGGYLIATKDGWTFATGLGSVATAFFTLLTSFFPESSKKSKKK